MGSTYQPRVYRRRARAGDYVRTLPAIQPGPPRTSLVYCLWSTFQDPQAVRIPLHGLIGSTVPASRSPIAASTQPTAYRPKNVVRISGWTGFSDGVPVACEIVYPSLSPEEAIVSVIIEIKTSNLQSSLDQITLSVTRASFLILSHSHG